MPGIDEALAALQTELGSEGPDSDKTKALAQKVKTVVPALGNSLFNAGFLKGQTEGEKKVTPVTVELNTAKERIAELETEVADIKKKAPDAAALEVQYKERERTEKEKAKAKLDAQEAITIKAVKEANSSALVSRLIAKGVEPLYAKRAVAAEYDANIEAKADGSVRILQAPGGLPFDGDIEKQLDALAAHALKSVPAHLIAANTDTGGGTGNENGGGGSGSYDAAKEGEARGKQQKAQRSGEKSLAFR